MTLINSSFWIIQSLPDSNTNNVLFHTLLFCRNHKSMPEFDLAIKRLNCEVLEEIIQFVIQSQIIKVIISKHVHYESPNPNEDPQR